MEHSCRQFVKVLKNAKEKGAASPNILQIFQDLGKLPPGFSALDVFEMCKNKGWVGGTAWSPWLTAEGEKNAS